MYCIYKIENKITSDFYIGYTRKVPFELRFIQHKINSQNGQSSHLYRAIRKYGFESFSFEVLEVGENDDFGLKISEPLYISWLSPKYNMTCGGDGILGFKFTEDQNKRNSERQKGKIKKERTIEHNRKLAETKIGVPRSEDCKRKISISKLGKSAYWNKNRVITEETRLKMSWVAKNRKKKNESSYTSS